jgi:hypothetical protein
MKKTIFLTLMSRLGPDEVPDEWVLPLLDGAGTPKTKPEPEPEPEPGTLASLSKHWEDGTGPYADCGGEKGRRKTKPKTKGSVPCRSGQCPCETERGVRCENPVVKGTRRCKEHTGKSLGFSLSRAQRKLLVAAGQKESVPVHGKVVLRSVEGLRVKGLITYAPPRSASKSGRVTITDWGTEVIAGLRFW